MRCTRQDCFAFNNKWDNNCEALHDTADCHFFKTRGQLYDEITELIEKGKPQYEPSSTRKGQRRLKALLGGKNARADNMDKT